MHSSLSAYAVRLSSQSYEPAKIRSNKAKILLLDVCLHLKPLSGQTLSAL